MYIQRVKIKRVRGFKEVDLDFTRPAGSPAGWTVLAGRNGSGKSTLLKAIALAVAGPRCAPAIHGSFAGWVRREAPEGRVNIRVQLGDDDAVTTFNSPGLIRPSRWNPELALSWRVTVEGRESLPLPCGSAGSDEEDRNLEKNLTGPWGENPIGWFLTGFGPYRRLTGHATDAQRLMEGASPISRMVNLFREDASLIECVTWLREIYLRRLEEKPGAAELEQSVLSLLNDGLLPGEIQVEGIDSEGLWVRQDGVRLPLQELSDGYRTTAALVMDIVRHLYLCFGELRVKAATDWEGTFRQVLHTGVVLIDEMETHLHVSWQKRIGFWLKRHFPNIQFIVTTHSPFICQAADPRGLIRLPAPGEDRLVDHVPESLYYTVVNGGADDAVLTELFGLDTAYSRESEKLREEIARLETRVQRGEATSGDRQSLAELRSRLPRTMSTDVEQALTKLTADL